MVEPTDPGRVNPAIDAEREALLKALVDHGVQFVVIGGAGIQSHGRRYDTLDIGQAEGPGVLPRRRRTRPRLAACRRWVISSGAHSDQHREELVCRVPVVDRSDSDGEAFG
jgi:hypothetical protein